MDYDWWLEIRLTKHNPDGLNHVSKWYYDDYRSGPTQDTA